MPEDDTKASVALRKESVDRNTFPGFGMEIDGVALRKESVDRNRVCIMTITTCTAVALRKESVDRNDVMAVSALPELIPSLSVRRAWIEMPKQLNRPPPLTSRSP